MIQFPLNLRNSALKENFAWSQGSLWLSLDRFERFWPDVGLALSRGEAVKSAVRVALGAKFAIDVASRAKYAADPDAEDDFEYIDRYEELAETCLRSINETAGAQDAECVVRWLTGPVLAKVKEPLWHNEWSSLFYHMGQEDPSTLALLHGISGDTARRIVEIAARYRKEWDANHERVEAADQEPLTGWDAVAYADYRWETPILSPLDGLWLHLNCICFDRAWAEVLRFARPADVDGLILWGRAHLREYPSGIPEDYAIIPEDARRAS